MTRFEYKVVPAPHKGTKAKSVRTPEGRFANSVEQVLNEMAQAGWEYQRAELLPQTERSGMTGSKTDWRNVLVFRRALIDAPTSQEDEAEKPEPILIAPTPDDQAPESDAQDQSSASDETSEDAPREQDSETDTDPAPEPEETNKH